MIWIAYQLYNYYEISSDPNGNTTGKPLETYYDSTVQSELISSWEAGLELKFFNNRLGFDVAWYKSNAKRQLMNIPMDNMSGYKSRKINAGNIQNLVGNPDRYSFVLYNKDISTVLCPTLKADKNGGFLITYNNFTEQEGRLLCYAGIDGSTLGNSVKFTEVMLVEGFLPAPVWTPSFSEQQAEIKTIRKP